MKRTLPVLLFLAVAFWPASVALAYNAYIVTDPAELQLVDLNEASRYVSDQFTGKFDILNDIRRAAGRKLIKGWGLKKQPVQAQVRLGVVADTSSGPLEFACVVTGQDLDCALLRSRLLEKYGNHWRRHKKPTAISEIEVDGEKVTVLPYMERKGEFVIAIVANHVVFGSMLPGHYGLLERTLAVLKDPSLRKAGPPAGVHLAYKGALTAEERGRVKEFFQRTIVGKVEKFRKGFEKLYQGLDSQDFDPQEFRSTNEKVNDLYLKLVDWSMDLQYSRGAGPRDDIYRLSCSLTMPSPEEAQAFKELLLEKVLFYKENSAGKAGVAAMDAIGLDVSGSSVTIRAETDTTEGTYNMFFAYYNFLLGYSQADRYLGVN